MGRCGCWSGYVLTTETNSDGSVTTSVTSYTFTYDANGHEIASEMSENGEKEYFYAATWDGDLPTTAKYVYYRGDDDLKWEDSESHTFTFNDKNQLIADTYENYDGYDEIVWNSSQSTYTYDDVGNYIQHNSEFEAWTGIDTVVAASISAYSYDSYGYHTGYLKNEDDYDYEEEEEDNEFEVVSYKTYVNTYSDGTVSSSSDVDADGFILDFDCDDGNVHAFSFFSSETCDGFDNNCDGQIDENLTVKTYYRDADGDGYGNDADTVVSCVQPSGYTNKGGDCDDANVDVENDTDYLYPDTDGDGFGASSGGASICSFTVGYADNNDDCNDGDANIEDVNKISQYKDGDGDGYGAGTSSSVCEGTPGYVENSSDCNDNDANIGYVGTEYVYPDADGDGHGDSSVASGSNVCIGTPNYASSNDDCNDSNPEIYPGHSDLEFDGDGIDNDCDGIADDGVISRPYP